MRVAARLGTPFRTLDASVEYKKGVIDYLLAEYKAGRTPNPDVMCNREVKFGVFYRYAKEHDADFIATGHYARIDRPTDVKDPIETPVRLLRGLDPNKDQSYFLYRVPQLVLRRTLMPIGHLPKPEVRKLAAELQLPVAEKPDSQGICFIGKLDMQEFLRKKLPPTPGDIVDENGVILGQHQGLDGYTIGQRHGILVSKGEAAWYVAKKDLTTNRLIAVQGSEHPLLFAKETRLHDMHWTCLLYTSDAADE